eukprot:1030153-Rhodomonas_salina.1
MEKDSADSTKPERGYKSHANHFVQFLKHLNPAVVSDEGSVDLVAVALEDVKAFFDHVSIKHVNVRAEGVFLVPVPQVNDKQVLNSASH